MQNWQPGGVIFDEHHAQVPTVLKMQDCWRIYYSGKENDISHVRFIDVEIGNPHKIIRKAGPILVRGPLGSFDHYGVMPTSALLWNDQVYLYYIGWSRRLDVPYQNSVGLAIGDGEKFDKTPGPILSTSTEDPYFCGTFHVFKEWRKFYRLYAYYLSCTEWVIKDKPEPRYLIKTASSDDGITWKLHGPAIKYSHEEEAIANASVVEIDVPGKSYSQKEYHMWYCYRHINDYKENPTNAYKIGYAIATGEEWRRLDNEVSLPVRPWCSIMQCYPNVIKHENKLYMFYNGNGFGKTGIGYATLSAD